MPPSDNDIQRSAKTGYRYDTDEYKLFKHAITVWEMLHRQGLKEVRASIQDWKYIGLEIGLEFPESALFNKQGGIKRLDATNRLKALCDALSKLLERDDSHFWEVLVFKQVGKMSRCHVKVYEVVD